MMRRILECVCVVLLGMSSTAHAQTALPEAGAYLTIATQLVTQVDAENQGAVQAEREGFIASGEALRVAVEGVRARIEALSFSEFPTFSGDPDDDTFLDAMGLARDAAMASALAEWMVTRYAQGNTVTNRLAAHISLTNAVATVIEADDALGALLPTLNGATIPAHPVARVVAPDFAAPGEVVTIVVTIVNVGDVASQNVLARISSIPFIGRRVQEVEIGDLAPQQTAIHVFNVAVPSDVEEAVFTIQVLGDNANFPRTDMISILVESAP